MAPPQGVPRCDGGPDAAAHREVAPRSHLRGAPPRLPVQDLHGAGEVGTVQSFTDIPTPFMTQILTIWLFQLFNMQATKFSGGY